MKGLCELGLAERRFEQANGLWWYRLTPEGEAAKALAHSLGANIWAARATAIEASRDSDTRRMAETQSGSVRSTGSAGPEGHRHD